LPLNRRLFPSWGILTPVASLFEIKIFVFSLIRISLFFPLGKSGPAALAAESSWHSPTSTTILLFLFSPKACSELGLISRWTIPFFSTSLPFAYQGKVRFPLPFPTEWYPLFILCSISPLRRSRCLPFSLEPRRPFTVRILPPWDTTFFWVSPSPTKSLSSD